MAVPFAAILACARAAAPEFIQVRHDIHLHPELAFKETRTSELIATQLRKWGYEVEQHLGRTGVVGQLRMAGGKRAIGLRADMDALPIAEATHASYASDISGVMHACGHDGHTATLLCAAKLLAESKRFSGTLNLIFQPAEESGEYGCGAIRMMEDGLFDKYPCDAIYGMHNMPGLPAGQLGLRCGALMASTDKVVITLTGKGGHGSAPQHAVDPVVAAASLTMALQTIVARNVDPQQAAVVTVGSLRAGTTWNVIPDTATLELSVRALDPAVRGRVRQRIEELVSACARGFAVKASSTYESGGSVLVNTGAETNLAFDVGVKLLGADHVTMGTPAVMASEDFSFMLERCKGCFVFLGNGDAEDAAELHSPRYDFNDHNIAIGAAFWQSLVETYLA